MNWDRKNHGNADGGNNDSWYCMIYREDIAICKR
jgi:hypothetical protein